MARAAVAVLAACAAYEAAVALGWISLGTEPGAGPAGGRLVVLAAILAMFAGVVAGAVATARGASAMLPLAAAGFVVARFYTYDEYYLPDLRRMSDAGAVRPAWIFSLVAVACLASLTAVSVRTRASVSRTARAGAAWLTVASLLLSAVTALVVGTGH